MLIPQADIDRELVKRGGLHEFVRRAWKQVESVPFVDNWHIGAISEHLEACQNRQIRKLIINEPPGFMKSLEVSVFYPAWVWTLVPSEKFIFTSFDASLSERDARKHREIIAGDWYRDRWDVRLPTHAARQVRMFTNSAHGFRFSTSTGGKGTGRHANQIVIDDPTKPKDTIGGAEQTRKRLDEAVNYYRGTLRTRQADPATTVQILMMQRLHDADLAGVLLAEGGWEHLMLPMHYDPKRSCVTVLGQIDKRTKAGELLWPERFPEAEVADLETSLQGFASSQLEQNPVPVTGGIFQRDWFKNFWSPGGIIPGTIPLPAMTEMSLTSSWDLNFKGKADSDPVSGQAWGKRAARFFLIDRVGGQWAYVRTKEEFIQFHIRYPAIYSKLVEDKANGPAIIDDLSKDIPGIEAVTPEGGKEARAHATSHLWKSGNCWLPHPSLPGMGWVPAYIEQHCRFPRALHDDDVDATSQALNRLYTRTPLYLEAMTRVRDEGLVKKTLPAQILAVVLDHGASPIVSSGPGSFADLQRRASQGS